jgi:hypothetical protein
MRDPLNLINSFEPSSARDPQHSFKPRPTRSLNPIRPLNQLNPGSPIVRWILPALSTASLVKPARVNPTRPIRIQLRRLALLIGDPIRSSTLTLNPNRPIRMRILHQNRQKTTSSDSLWISTNHVMGIMIAISTPSYGMQASKIPTPTVFNALDPNSSQINRVLGAAKASPTVPAITNAYSVVWRVGRIWDRYVLLVISLVSQSNIRSTVRSSGLQLPS